MRLDTLVNTASKLSQLDTPQGDSTQTISNLVNKPLENLVLGIPEEIARILIPVSVTITIFLLGHFISWLKGKFERKKEVDAYKNLILKWIELTKKPIENQLASCNEFIESLERSQDMASIQFKAYKLLAEKIDSLPLEKLVNAFSTNTTGEADKNYKMIFNLIGKFNYLKHVEGLIEKNFDEYNKLLDEMIKQWNLKFTEFDNIVSIHNKEIGRNRSHPSFEIHSELLKIISEWLRTAPKDVNSILYVEEKLVNPLIQLLTNRELNNIQDDYTYELSRIMIDMKVEIMQWKGAKNSIATLFKGVVKEIKHAYEKLEEANLYFMKNTHTVNVLRIK